MAKKPDDSKTFRTDNLDLCTYLLLHKIVPFKRETEGRTSFLLFPRTSKVDKLVAEFFNPCPQCGITFKDVGPVRAGARKMLVHGELDGRQ